MSLWEKVVMRDNLKNNMEEYYQQKCQFQLRCALASWIEEYFKSEGDIRADSGPLFQQVAKKFVEALKLEIQRVFPAYTGIFETIGQYTEEEYYRHLRNGIAQELQMMSQSNGVPAPHELTAVIIQLNQGLPSIISTEDSFRSLCDRLQSSYNEYSQLQMSHSNNSLDMEKRVQMIKEQYNIVMRNIEMLIAQIRQYISHYETALNSVITELKKWQRSQAYGGNGQPYRENLDEIQDWIEGLLGIINAVRDVINRILACFQQYTFGINDKYRPHLTNLSEQIMHLQENLIISSFIVEKQPPQVMKTNTRFAATVRWLIGQQLGISATNPQVECVILSEAQAQRHFAQRPIGNCPPHSSGEITNNSSSMEFQQQSRHFTASFRNMQLKKIKRAEKKGTESVMDEKFALLFYTTTSFGNEYRIRAWTLSLPVVVIVHGNQEPQSWATITWDNAFAEITREPFQVPERVPWSLLSAALNTKFQSQTKRALTAENMRFLCEKVFRSEFVPDDTKNYITWAQFCKEPLPDRTFTFWDWFFAIMKLTKDHLLGPWQAGHIVGFINKRQTIEQMKQFQDGTFLLRFSDSELGGISISWVKGNEVLMLQPWTAKDLNVRALADRIKDVAYLQYLYPNISKDEAFANFYSPPGSEQRRDGYVKSIIIAHIPGYSEQPSNASYPNTPQHNSMQSPNHSVEMGDVPGSSNTYNNYSSPLDDFDYLQDDIDSNVKWNKWNNIMQ